MVDPVLHLWLKFQKNIKHSKDFTERSLDRCDRDRMVVGYITTYAISAYHH